MLQQSLAMWERLVEQVRRTGLRKIVLFVLAAAVAVALAYGVNSTNNAASGRTLPRIQSVSSNATGASSNSLSRSRNRAPSAP